MKKKFIIKKNFKEKKNLEKKNLIKVIINRFNYTEFKKDIKKSLQINQNSV
jgi:hypothetical protein